MKVRILRRLLSTGAVAAAAAVMVVGQPAGANSFTPTFGTSPHWFTGGVHQVRQAGSETTYFAMQRLSDLYNGSSLFGCTLSTADFQTCDTTVDGDQTDVKDNYDRTEVTQGEGIGSGGGIGQLCGNKPTPFPVDLARASRALDPVADSCANGKNAQFGKDALVGLDFQLETPVATGTHGDTTPAIGPVAKGWRPGDPLAGPYTGIAFSNIDGHGTGGDSIAKRIWVDTGGTRITDWGQLTDPNATVGAGTPIGVPILAWAVNVNSGTSDVWGKFADGSKTDVANASRNPCSTFGCPGTNEPIIQENNAPQIRSIAATDAGCDPKKALTDSTQPSGCKPVQAENKIMQSLYFGSFGVLSSNPFSQSNAKQTKVNSLSVTKPAIAADTPATKRALVNAYRSDTLKGSAAGFLNWIDLRDGESGMSHGTDLITGVSYDTEIINTITTKFGFVLVSGIPAIPNGDVALPNS